MALFREHIVMLPLSPTEITSNHNSQLFCNIQPAKELTQHHSGKNQMTHNYPMNFMWC